MLAEISAPDAERPNLNFTWHQQPSAYGSAEIKQKMKTIGMIKFIEVSVIREIPPAAHHILHIHPNVAANKPNIKAFRVSVVRFKEIIMGMIATQDSNP